MSTCGSEARKRKNLVRKGKASMLPVRYSPEKALEMAGLCQVQAGSRA